MTRIVAALVALLAGIQTAALDPGISAVFTRYWRFTASDLADLRKGRVVKHGLETTASDEIAVAGAIRVTAAPSAFVDAVRHIVEFKSNPDVLQIGRFSDPPQLEDMRALTVGKEDFDAASCRVNDCGVRLPADLIRRLPAAVDVKAPDAQERAARWFKQTLFTQVNAYWSGTPGRFLTYDDDAKPIRPVDEFNGLMKNAPAIGALSPALRDHLASFPANRMAGAEDVLYWSKEKFGIEPFITVTHVVIACPSERLCLVASKDVYSSRYIDASLALSVTSLDTVDGRAFYLVYVNQSRSSSLKGRLSSLRKSIAERRARGSLEETLKTLRRRFEGR
ncbi:MAG TPA: hypothetical protein VF219_17585 [Vicinamibacterales bacterium]